MVDGWLWLIVGPVREIGPLGEIGPVREIGVGVGDRHDMQTFRLPD